jgi:hypothetical protein
VARELVSNGQRSISAKPPKKHAVKDLSSSRRSDWRSTRFWENSLASVYLWMAAKPETLLLQKV